MQIVGFMSRSAHILTTRQHGTALLALTLLLMTILLSATLGHLNSNSTNTDRTTREALMLARDALIGSAITYRDTHADQVDGYLPCPDDDDDGNAEGSCGASGAPVLGRLPWKTLGIPPLRDRSGACLWYAVSGNAKNASKTKSLNWDTVGQFTIRDVFGKTIHGESAHTRPLAVIFAPGPPLAGQEHRKPSNVIECTGSDLPQNYLENIDAAWTTSKTAREISIVLAPPGQSLIGNAKPSNDQGIWIDSYDIFNPIKRRSDFKTDIDTLMDNLVAFLKPLVPNAMPKATTTNKGVDVLIANYLNTNPVTKEQTFINQWRDQLLYAQSSSSTFQTNDSPANCRGVLIFAGERTSTQLRRDLFERNDPKMYLERSNAEQFPRPGRYVGGAEYDNATPSADIVRCLLPISAN